MLSKAEYPHAISPKELDDYLSKGWFRMGQSIFTSHFLNFNSIFYSSLWLRLDLDEWRQEKAHLKLASRNKSFEVRVQAAQITDEKECLYLKYSSGLDFSPSPSIHSLLYGDSSEDIFNTLEVVVYDGGKLIGFGFFDLGLTTAAGISSVYDHHYSRYSLGKYIIQKKIEYCKQLGLKYFYPGYVAPGYPAFDYKLKLGQGISFMKLRDYQWCRWEDFDRSSDLPIDVMRRKLEEVLDKLGRQRGYRVMQYEYFSANLIPDLKDMELFDYPLFLCNMTQDNELSYPIVIFDVVRGEYKILRCLSLWKSEVQFSEGVYGTNLLKVLSELERTSDPVILAESLAYNLSI